MYIKVLYNIKNCSNNKTGRGGGECRCRRLDLSQNHHKLEKKTKKEEKSGEKNCVRSGIEPTARKLQILHLTC